MNSERHTTFINTYPPKLIATILKALLEQLEENDQLNGRDCPTSTRNPS